ncbi:conserved hypothetical protein [Bradyrhizobium sp. STM 3843]|uniref:hypothetical protein n=1 Tax=Bradyrhizobium sp. STM 3843 TaxID=551947 RepID=UPI0002403ACE|nr:hypothetical protein [Bradyrhizobium sp. STM 3843]CCE11508.1 conserved hypothetical protein [Bradyrhizobium sp. STM 3843]
MFPNRDAFDDSCPVGEELLGEMYRASENGLPALVESVSSDVRAMLALFCYRRSHLHSLALAIAATCSERELLQSGGRVGAVLYAQSRDSKVSQGSTASSGRKPISLSTKPLSVLAPLEDDLDDDLAAVTG